MNVKLITIFTLNLTIRLISSCKQGCLSCDFKSPTLKCNLCDYDNFYVPIESHQDHTTFMSKFVEKTSAPEEKRQIQDWLLEITKAEELESTNTDQSLNDSENQNPDQQSTRLCVKIDMPYCLNIGFRFEQIVCLKCQEKFWFNPSLRSCVEVETEIENCIYYFSKDKCMTCKNNFYLDQKNYTCRKAEFLPSGFEKCVEVNTHGECIKCAEKYYLDWEVKIDSKKVKRCATKEELWGDNIINNIDKSILDLLGLAKDSNDLPVFDPHCISHSLFTCQECDENFQTVIPIQKKLAEELRLDNLINIKKFDPISEKICHPSKIPNCERYQYISDSKAFCDKCETGYYLDLESRQQCFKNPIPSIPHCKIYKSESICLMCNDGYERINDELCFPQITQEDCLEVNHLGSCQKCKDNMILDTEKNICIQRNNNLDNCAIFSKLKEGCIKCDEGYFMYTDQSVLDQDLLNYYDADFYTDDWELKLEREPSPFELKICYPIPNYPIKNCLSHFIYSRGCEICEEGYHLSIDKTTCLYTIPYCKETVTKMSDPNGSTFCFECEVGYAPSENKSSCVEYKIPNCKIHNQREKSCIQCERGYYFKLDDHPNFPSPIRTSCEPFPDKNCHINEENSEMCIECKRGYYLDIPDTEKLATLCVAKSEMFDERCQSHDTMNDDRMCSSCSDNYAQIHIQNFGIEEIQRSGCLIFDYHQLTCRECKTDYGTLKDGLCSEFDDSSICKKLLPFRNSLDYEDGLLKNNKRCQRCRDPEKYYLNENHQCILRDENKYRFCTEKYQNQDMCKKCDDGLFFARAIDVSTCQKEPENFEKIDNCLVYSYPDEASCLYCKPSFILQNSECVLDESNLIQFWMKPGMKLVPNKKKSDLDFSIINRDLPKNCAQWVQINNFEIECVKCKNGHIGIIFDSNETPRLNRHGLNPFSGNFEPQAVFYSVLKCESDMSKFLGYKDSSTPDQYILDDKCLYGKDIGGKLLCLTCKERYVAKLGNKTYTNESGKFSNFNMVTDCIETNDKEIKYVGYGLDKLAYKSKTYNGYSHPVNNHFMAFDSCKDKDNILVYLSKPVPSENFLNFKCIQKTFFSSEFSNCQIYQWTSSDPISQDPRNDKNWKCIACKPGHRPFFGPKLGDQTDSLLSCEPVPNCNLDAPENIWMNACAMPEKDYGHVIQAGDISESNSAQIDLFFHEPLSTVNRSENCLIYSESTNSSLSKCLLCKPGYYSNIETKCLPISTTHCKQHDSYLTNHFKLLNLPYFNQIRSLFSLKYINSDDQSKFYVEGLGCSECENGYILTLSKDEDDFLCENYSFYKTVNNCTAYGGSNRTCTECKSGFIITSTHECEPADKYPFCAHLDISFDHSNHEIFYICTECIEGYYLSDINTCHQKITSHCMIDIENEDDVHICPICLPGYKLTDGPHRICVLHSDLSDPCMIYNSDDFCLRCKNPNQIPINYNFIDKSLNFSLCLDADFSFDWSPIKHNLFLVQELTENFLALTHASNGMFFVDEKKISHDFTIFPNLPQTVCIGFADIAKCEEFHPDSKFLCTKCKSSFYLQNYRCLIGTTKNCKVYKDDENLCLNCDDGYYLNHANSCRKYDFDDNCKNQNYDQTNGKCVECEKGYYPVEYFNNGEDAIRCTLFNQNLNCLEFDPIDGNCLSCSDDFHYLISSKKCYAKSLITPNCKYIDESKMICYQCEEGFFMSGYDTCSPRPNVDLCVSYSLETGRCVLCQDGHFIKLIGNNYKCIPNPNGIENCLEYLDSDRCSKCQDSYMVDPKSFKCLLYRHEVENCIEYLDDIECLHCEKGFILRFNFCFEIENTNCEEWLDEKNCRECPPDRFLINENGFWDCAKPTFNNCLVIQKPEYKFEFGYTFRTYPKQDLMLALDNIMYHNLTTNFYSLKDAKCQQCDEDMIFDDKENNCVELLQSEKISGCKLYSNDKKCSLCSSDFYLDQSNQICEKIIPIQNEGSWREMIPAFKDCKVMNKWKTPQCVRCQEGYYLNIQKYNYIDYQTPNEKQDKIFRPGFQANENESIEKLNQKFRICKPCSMNNCAICLPDAPHDCLVCKSDFYMIQNDYGKTECVINYEVQGFNNNNNKEVFDSFLKKSSISMIIFLMLLGMKIND